MVVRGRHACVLQACHYHAPVGKPMLVRKDIDSYRNIHMETNCFTEIFVDKALDRAEEVDKHLKTTGNVLGPLHGLPISLKDQVQIKDLETVMGASAVHISHASGGEGALIALKDSPLGVDSDLGGCVVWSYLMSLLTFIADLSACCGLYGLRPSYHRIPYRGTENSREGQDVIVSPLGPMSSRIGGIKTFMIAIIDAEPWQQDPIMPRMPWSERGDTHLTWQREVTLLRNNLG